MKVNSRVYILTSQMLFGSQKCRKWQFQRLKSKHFSWAGISPDPPPPLEASASGGWHLFVCCAYFFFLLFLSWYFSVIYTSTLLLQMYAFKQSPRSPSPSQTAPILDSTSRGQGPSLSTSRFLQHEGPGVLDGMLGHHRYTYQHFGWVNCPDN